MTVGTIPLEMIASDVHVLDPNVTPGNACHITVGRVRISEKLFVAVPDFTGVSQAHVVTNINSA